MNCKICKKYFKNMHSLTAHVFYHGLKITKYLVDYENLKIPKCPICKEPCKIRQVSIFNKTCGKKECIKKVLSSHKHSLSTKQHLRRLRFEYLKKRLGKTAWERKNKGQLSYLEKWFLEDVIVRFELTKKYDIINELQVLSN